VFHPIADQHAAVLEGPALPQLKVNLAAHRMEQWDARAQQDRMNVEANLVNQIGLKQGPRLFAAPGRTHQTPPELLQRA
jgi:hypothetical protein